MLVHLVHHADALPEQFDSQRPLSSLGLAQADALAGAARRRGAQPALIWHSGKLRARQTAEVFLRTCAPFATFRMVRGLRPDDSIDWIRDALEGEDQDVLIAGHMPHIAQLAVALGAVSVFPVHGMVALERKGPRRYEEVWREAPPNRL